MFLFHMHPEIYVVLIETNAENTAKFYEELTAFCTGAPPNGDPKKRERFKKEIDLFKADSGPDSLFGENLIYLPCLSDEEFHCCQVWPDKTEESELYYPTVAIYLDRMPSTGELQTTHRRATTYFEDYSKLRFNGIEFTSLSTAKLSFRQTYTCPFKP